MADINIDYINQLVVDWCTENNIDPATFLASGTIDLNDPDLQPYLVYAAECMVYLASGGSPTMGANGEIDFPDQAELDAIYNDPANADLRDEALNILSGADDGEGDPALMAFFLMQNGGSTEEVNQLLAEIGLSSPDALQTEAVDTTSASYIDQQTRDFIEQYNLGSGLEYLLSYEEGVQSAIASILGQIADQAQVIATCDPTMVEAETANLNYLYTQIQQIQTNATNFMEMYSNMLKQMSDTAMNTVRNM